MISLIVLTRDKPNLERVIGCFLECLPEGIEHEIIIGDNSYEQEYCERNRELADIYVRVPDKMLWRMGIPFVHNYLNSFANSYNIIYIDDDEYITYIAQDIEELFEKSAALLCFRLEDCTYQDAVNYRGDLHRINEHVKEIKGSVSIQDRVYNSRYTHFRGVCHSIFEVDRRGDKLACFLFHGKDLRPTEGNTWERKQAIIDEQFIKQNHNRFISSSVIVEGWGKDLGKGHRYEDYKEFIEKFRREVK